MTTSGIPERQNSPPFMQLLRARSQTYRRATQLQLVQLGLTVVSPVLMAVAGLFVSDLRPFAGALSVGATLADVGVLDRALKRRLKAAALICERFDCELLGIPWNRFAAGRQPEPETIAEAERSWRGGDDELVDWYPTVIGLAPAHLARIVCQRTNLWYDAQLRERYSLALVCGAALVVLALVVAGLSLRLSLTDFVVTVVVPAAPVLTWAVRDAFRQRDAADAQKTARAEAEALWELAISGGCDEEQCGRRSREFQNSILQRRIANPLLLPWIYRWLRPGMEADMNVGAEKLLEQAGIAPMTDQLPEAIDADEQKVRPASSYPGGQTLPSAVPLPPELP